MENIEIQFNIKLNKSIYLSPWENKEKLLKCFWEELISTSCEDYINSFKDENNKYLEKNKEKIETFKSIQKNILNSVTYLTISKMKENELSEENKSTEKDIEEQEKITVLFSFTSFLRKRSLLEGLIEEEFFDSIVEKTQYYKEFVLEELNKVNTNLEKIDQHFSLKIYNNLIQVLPEAKSTLLINGKPTIYNIRQAVKMAAAKSVEMEMRERIEIENKYSAPTIDNKINSDIKKVNLEMNFELDKNMYEKSLYETKKIFFEQFIIGYITFDFFAVAIGICKLNDTEQKKYTNYLETLYSLKENIFNSYHCETIETIKIKDNENNKEILIEIIKLSCSFIYYKSPMLSIEDIIEKEIFDKVSEKNYLFSKNIKDSIKIIKNGDDKNSSKSKNYVKEKTPLVPLHKYIADKWLEAKSTLLVKIEDFNPQEEIQ